MIFSDYHLHIKDLHLNYNDALELLHVTDHSSDNPVVSDTIHLFNQLEDIAEIHGGYMVYEGVTIDMDGGTIGIENKHINPQKQVCGYLRGIEKIALFVCTAGAGFSTYTNKFNNEGDYLKGFIIDTLGSLVVEKSMDLIQQKIENDFLGLGLKTTNRYSPGYCNWPTENQRQLFSMLPENPCNIQLSDSSLMIPIKSVSGIIGIGKNVKKKAYACNVCKDQTCIFRKVNQ